MGLALALHVVAAAIWIGGMFFLLACLRPALGFLDPPLRMRVQAGVLSRFFRWVWLAFTVLMLSGLWMIFGPLVNLRQAGHHVQVMLGVGVLMAMLTAHVYFAPYKRMKRLIAQGNWPLAGRQAEQIRWLVTVNLGLGLLIVLVAILGRHWSAA